MMALIFAVLTAALASLFTGPRWLALALAAVGLALSTGLFLFEIHSPTDGFRMPWIQVRAATPDRAA